MYTALEVQEVLTKTSAYRLYFAKPTCSLLESVNYEKYEGGLSITYWHMEVWQQINYYCPINMPIYLKNNREGREKQWKMNCYQNREFCLAAAASYVSSLL